MSIILDGTTGITSPTYGGTDAAEYIVPITAFKNRIINGNMAIDQRNAGAAVTVTGFPYTLDRWLSGATQSSKYTVQQNAGSVTPPVGFTNYLGVTSLSSYSLLTADYFTLGQIIEGFNVADLAWGAANAATVTLSFWARSSLTGTFGGSLRNGTSPRNRTYPFSYAINSANTWEQKSITIAGDTTGTWITNNGAGLELLFGLGVGPTYSGTAGSWSGSNFLSTTGAVSVVGTSGATFYITGVQLEKGSTATSFDQRDYGRELAMCQRYFEVQVITLAANAIAGTGAQYTQAYAVVKRATPTMTAAGGTVVSGTDLVDSGTTGLNGYRYILLPTVNGLISCNSRVISASAEL